MALLPPVLQSRELWHGKLCFTFSPHSVYAWCVLKQYRDRVSIEYRSSINSKQAQCCHSLWQPQFLADLLYRQSSDSIINSKAKPVLMTDVMDFIHGNEFMSTIKCIHQIAPRMMHILQCKQIMGYYLLLLCTPEQAAFHWCLKYPKHSPCPLFLRAL